MVDDFCHGISPLLTIKCMPCMFFVLWDNIFCFFPVKESWFVPPIEWVGSKPKFKYNRSNYNSICFRKFFTPTLWPRASAEYINARFFDKRFMILWAVAIFIWKSLQFDQLNFSKKVSRIAIEMIIRILKTAKSSIHVTIDFFFSVSYPIRQFRVSYTWLKLEYKRLN